MIELLRGMHGAGRLRMENLADVAIPSGGVYAPRMRYLVAASLGLLIFSGCASDRLDAEDKSFFYGGWMQPDKAADERLMKVGGRTEVYGRRTPVGDQGSPTQSQQVGTGSQ